MSDFNASEYIRSAAEAEHNTPESVCGTDERQVVDPLSPYYEAICFLGIDAADGTKWRGTGFYINYGGQAALLTAAHCIYIRDHGGYASKVNIVQGKDGNSQPRGVVTVNSSNLRVPEAWKNSGNHTDDWGIIIVGGRPWGLGVQTLNDSQLVGTEIKTAGYPSDKPGYKMWKEQGPVKSVTPQKIYYMEDTYGGQSGSPIWAQVPGQTYWNAVGVHAYGGCPNSSTRITSAMLNQINEWI